MLISKNKKKVFVGLSGGVDSSVSAYLLKKSGYDVTGVFIKAWHPDFLPCNWKNEMRDAMRVCAKLDIKFLLCDLSKEYKKEIIDYLINEYQIGHTPNPDVLCNKKIKFGGFLDWSIKKGADFVATGHYVRNESIENEIGLFNAIDQEKDQTYFLWTLNQRQISKILFPIGHLEKKEVRKIAARVKLNTAAKKDSQGLCFLGHVNMKSFLRRYIKTEKGDVLNTKGDVIGVHDGAELYTIGERHGFTIFNNMNLKDSNYVISKDMANNTITVAENIIKSNESKISKITLNKVSFVRDTFYELVKKDELVIKFMIRYRGILHNGTLLFSGGKYIISSKEPIERVANGQSIVIYQNKECLGGGIVENLA